MRDGVEKREAKDVKLREVGVEEVLKSGFGGEGREFETRATDVQMGLERWVAEQDEVSDSLLFAWWGLRSRGSSADFVLLWHYYLLPLSFLLPSPSSSSSLPLPPTFEPTPLIPLPKNQSSTRKPFILDIWLNRLECVMLLVLITKVSKGREGRNLKLWEG